MNRCLRSVIALVLLLHAPYVGAQTQQQTFKISLPGIVSITAENDLAEITHDLRERDQRFPSQRWSVTSQNSLGAVVTLQTNQAFTNTSDSTAKRDVQISLNIRNGPRWRVSQRRDETDYKSGDEIAIVRAESDRAGDANFNLRVIFREESVDDLMDGDYELTVIGTISPK